MLPGWSTPFFAWVLEGWVSLGSVPTSMPAYADFCPKEAFVRLFLGRLSFASWTISVLHLFLFPLAGHHGWSWKEGPQPVLSLTAFVLRASTRNSLQIHTDAPDCKNLADPFLYWLCIPKIEHIKKLFHVKWEAFDYTGRTLLECKVTPTRPCTFCPLVLIQCL